MTKKTAAALLGLLILGCETTGDNERDDTSPSSSPTMDDDSSSSSSSTDASSGTTTGASETDSETTGEPADDGFCLLLQGQLSAGGNQFAVHILRDGVDPELLVPATGFITPSPDHGKLAWTDEAGLHVYAIESAEQADFPGADIANLQWAPDSSGIAFYRGVDDYRELWVAPVDPGGAALMLLDEVQNGSAAWDATGSALAFLQRPEMATTNTLYLWSWLEPAPQQVPLDGSPNTAVPCDQKFVSRVGPGGTDDVYVITVDGATTQISDTNPAGGELACSSDGELAVWFRGGELFGNRTDGSTPSTDITQGGAVLNDFVVHDGMVVYSDVENRLLRTAFDNPSDTVPLVTNLDPESRWKVNDPVTTEEIDPAALRAVIHVPMDIRVADIAPLSAPPSTEDAAQGLLEGRRVLRHFESFPRSVEPDEDARVVFFETADEAGGPNQLIGVRVGGELVDGVGEMFTEDVEPSLCRELDGLLACEVRDESDNVGVEVIRSFFDENGGPADSIRERIMFDRDAAFNIHPCR